MTRSSTSPSARPRCTASSSCRAAAGGNPPAIADGGRPGSSTPIGASRAIPRVARTWAAVLVVPAVPCATSSAATAITSRTAAMPATRNVLARAPAVHISEFIGPRLRLPSVADPDRAPVPDRGPDGRSSTADLVAGSAESSARGPGARRTTPLSATHPEMRGHAAVGRSRQRRRGARDRTEGLEQAADCASAGPTAAGSRRSDLVSAHERRLPAPVARRGGRAAFRSLPPAARGLTRLLSPSPRHSLRSMDSAGERSVEPFNVVIAGGGVAALETAFALRAVAGESARMTLVAPDSEFVYRPMAVREPFAHGPARRYQLAQIANDVGAELITD